VRASRALTLPPGATLGSTGARFARARPSLHHNPKYYNPHPSFNNHPNIYHLIHLLSFISFSIIPNTITLTLNFIIFQSLSHNYIISQSNHISLKIHSSSIFPSNLNTNTFNPIHFSFTIFHLIISLNHIISILNSFHNSIQKKNNHQSHHLLFQSLITQFHYHIIFIFNL
jgi:hypothetical protein